ncbi:MAG: hypothetical protein WCV59_04505 [Parcubacteria group bacterium]|jgi:hypothetical protein
MKTNLGVHGRITCGASNLLVSLLATYLTNSFGREIETKSEGWRILFMLDGNVLCAIAVILEHPRTNLAGEIIAFETSPFLDENHPELSAKIIKMADSGAGLRGTRGHYDFAHD